MGAGCGNVSRLLPWVTDRSEARLTLDTLSGADELHPLRADIQPLDLPTGICPCPPADMVALCLVIPPPPVFIRGRWQPVVQYSLDLLEIKRNFSLALRKIA